MPALLLFRHGKTLSLAVTNRRLHKRDEARDVLEKVTLIKDIRFANPHRAHVEILFDLSFDALRQAHDFTNFVALHAAWQKTLDSSELNKRFFQEIANWYFWALNHIHFPKDAPKEADGHDHISVIRLITRLIFCWFVKEKGLIPDALFDQRKLAQTLEGFAPDKSSDKDSVFYRAILQNLFFATLNTEMDKRAWAKEEQNFMAHSLYRFRECFRQPGTALDLFKNIPFLNGGLFECLDKDLGEKATPRYLRVDGFSRRLDSQPTVPDFLFFGPECDVDLSADYGDARFKRVTVRGLIHTFDHYKFTIAENTPIEEEIALDPELSGKVFENLLAAYNPETGATARKQTGSFFTPREIVNYMVDEALIAYLKTKMEASHPAARDVEARLRHLSAYNDEPHQFMPQEVDALISAIDSLKSLDPAVGSGAFPMGILHKLVFILSKLDKDNVKWRERQRRRAIEQTDTAFKIGDKDERMRRLGDINEVFEQNASDYGRKLYLIENCIYGVDIQPIAVQIAKMRFFISLIVDQKIDDAQPNRGVRPLPNLETKFVAANTLIAVNRPGQQMLRNRVIEAKEADLRRVRERHFMARTLAGKAKCRDQDAKLRAEIAELLKADGWDTATARNLASWDPYDQNTSAGFFDAEWMFGIIHGFDVCTGNPPYGANIDAFVELFERLYPNTTKAFKDIYKLFIELGLIKLLKDRGLLCYITPNTLLRQPRYKDARAFLNKYRLLQVLDFGLGVFEQVVPTCVFLAQRAASDEGLVRYLDLTEESHFARDLSSQKPVFFPQSQLLDLSHVAMGPTARRAQDGLILPLMEVLDLKDAGINYQRVNVGLAEKGNSDLGQRLLYEGHRESAADVEFWKGEDINRYFISRATGRFVRVNTTKTLRPNERVVLNREYFSRVPKLIWRQTAPWLIAALDLEGKWFGRSIQAATIKPKLSQLDYCFVLAVLNSSYFRYGYNRRVQEQGRVFPQVKFENLKALLLPVPGKDGQQPLVSLAGKILAAKQKDPNADTAALEREIDQRVYVLYGLTPEEIKIVEEAGA